MQARDFRSIGRAAQEELRRRALVLIEQQGLSQGQAAQMVGVHRQTVNIWLKRYRQQGEDGVLDGRRVSPRRGKGLLSAEEADQIRRWIVERAMHKFGVWGSGGGLIPGSLRGLPIAEADALDDLGETLRAVQPAPVPLGRLGQLEDHRERRLA